MPSSYRQAASVLLSGTGIWMMLFLLVFGISSKAMMLGWVWWDAAIIAGFIMFRSIIEWMIHAWLYHARPLPILGLRLHRITSKEHASHHIDPDNMDKLLVTWKGVLAISVSFLFPVWLITGSISLALSAMLGFVLVSIITETVHLIAHSRIPHSSRYISRLVELHRLHHHHHSDACFGVSSPLADRLFGTYRGGN